MYEVTITLKYFKNYKKELTDIFEREDEAREFAMRQLSYFVMNFPELAPTCSVVYLPKNSIPTNELQTM